MFKTVRAPRELKPAIAWDWLAKHSLVASAGSGTLGITRATEHYYIDDNNEISASASGAATYETTRGIKIIGARTNLNAHADFSGWTASGTPTRTGAAHVCGVMNMDLIGDDSASAAESYAQNISFTGDGVKSISFLVKEGTSAGWMIRLRDTTAAANRLLAVGTWSGGEPVITMTTGENEHGTFTPLADGVFRIQLRTTTVTAANTNTLQVFPASDAVNTVTLTGNVYCSALTVTNADHFMSEVPPATTHNLDQVTLGVGTWFNASEGTLVVRARPPHHSQAGDTACAVAFDDGTADNYIAIVRNTQLGRVEIGSGGVAQVSLALTGTWADATTATVAMRYRENLIAASINGGPVASDTVASIPTITQLSMGNTPAGSSFDGRIEGFWYYDRGVIDSEIPRLSR